MKNNDLTSAENSENEASKGGTVFERIIQSRAVLGLVIPLSSEKHVRDAIWAADALLEDAQRRA